MLRHIKLHLNADADAFSTPHQTRYPSVRSFLRLSVSASSPNDLTTFNSSSLKTLSRYQSLVLSNRLFKFFEISAFPFIVQNLHPSYLGCSVCNGSSYFCVCLWVFSTKNNCTRYSHVPCESCMSCVPCDFFFNPCI